MPDNNSVADKVNKLVQELIKKSPDKAIEVISAYTAINQTVEAKFPFRVLLNAIAHDNGRLADSLVKKREGYRMELYKENLKKYETC